MNQFLISITIDAIFIVDHVSSHWRPQPTRPASQQEQVCSLKDRLVVVLLLIKCWKFWFGMTLDQSNYQIGCLVLNNIGCILGKMKKIGTFTWVYVHKYLSDSRRTWRSLKVRLRSMNWIRIFPGRGSSKDSFFNLRPSKLAEPKYFSIFTPALVSTIYGTIK